MNESERTCKRMMKVTLVTLLALLLQGCVLTKVVSVPMRVAGAVISIIPVAGDAAHTAIDAAAEAVDTVPL
jgi:PBP1b-binding outer membrane lipoprotein LpoB